MTDKVGIHFVILPLFAEHIQSRDCDLAQRLAWHAQHPKYDPPWSEPTVDEALDCRFS